MRNWKNWSVIAGGALWSMLVVGCGNAAKLAGQENQANETQSTDQAGTEQSSGSGGSLALSSTNEADASVKKISIKVQTSLECDEGKGGKHGHKDMHDRRPPPPPRGKGHGEGKMPPPPRDDRDEEGADFKLADDVEAEAATTDEAATADEQGEDAKDRQQCVVAESEGDFDAASAMQLDEIPVGTYYVVVVLSDENGKAVQQGSAKVEIKAGEVSAAEITLEPVPEGSVSVTIKQAAEEEAAAEDTTDATAEASSDEAASEETSQEAAE